MTSGTPAPRRRTRLFIALFVALQIGLPASYYLSSERSDERFAWRMFSAQRMRGCQVAVAGADGAGGRTTFDVKRELQLAWVRWLERGDPAVTAAVARRVCERGAAAVHLERRCVTGDGRPLPPERSELPCGS